MAARFELRPSTNGGFHFNLKAENNRVILTSEHYNSKASALEGIESVRKNAVNDGSYERLIDRADQPYFVLKAANHRQIGRSESYSSEAALTNGIEAVKRDAPTAEIVELTS